MRLSALIQKNTRRQKPIKSIKLSQSNMLRRSEKKTICQLQKLHETFTGKMVLIFCSLSDELNHVEKLRK